MRSKSKRRSAADSVKPAPAVSSNIPAPGHIENCHVHRRFFFDLNALRAGGLLRSTFTKSENPMISLLSVIDLDVRHVERMIYRSIIPQFFTHPVYKFLYCLIVLTDVLIYTVQSIELLSIPQQRICSILHHAVLGVYVMEIIIKWFCGFLIYWKDGWNIFQFIIVFICFVLPGFSYLTIFVLVRLICQKLPKSLMRLPYVEGTVQLATAIIKSVPDMFNIAIVYIFFLSLLSTIGVACFESIYPKHFDDLLTGVFTFFQISTQDGLVFLHAETEELLNSYHTSVFYYVILKLLIVIDIIIGAFILINLLAAVILINLMDVYKFDEKEEVVEEGNKKTKKLNRKNHKGGKLHGGASGPISESWQKLPITLYARARRGLNLLTVQKPLQLSDFRSANPVKLENYLLLLAAQEQNLIEYNNIVKDLRNIHSYRKMLKKALGSSESDAEEDSSHSYTSAKQ